MIKERLIDYMLHAILLKLQIISKVSNDFDLLFAVLCGETFISTVLLSHPITGFTLHAIFLYPSFCFE